MSFEKWGISCFEYIKYRKTVFKLFYPPVPFIIFAFDLSKVFE